MRNQPLGFVVATLGVVLVLGLSRTIDAHDEEPSKAERATFDAWAGVTATALVDREPRAADVTDAVNALSILGSATLAHLAPAGDAGGSTASAKLRRLLAAVELSRSFVKIHARPSDAAWLCSSDDADEQLAGVASLGECEFGPEFEATCTRLARDPRPTVRYGAGLLLALECRISGTPPNARAVLSNLLVDRHPAVAAAVAHELFSIRDPVLCERVLDRATDARRQTGPAQPWYDDTEATVGERVTSTASFLYADRDTLGDVAFDAERDKTIEAWRKRVGRAPTLTPTAPWKAVLDELVVTKVGDPPTTLVRGDRTFAISLVERRQWFEDSRPMISQVVQVDEAEFQCWKVGTPSEPFGFMDTVTRIVPPWGARVCVVSAPMLDGRVRVRVRMWERKHEMFK